ncbi:MAG: hypothetical protein Q9213_003924 [Squamulea squamosa]
MSLNFTSAHSSRITKRRTPALKRSASSPFASFTQRKPVQRSKTKPETSAHDQEDWFDERLDDTGIITTLATEIPLKGVAQIVQYANAHMFEPMPERGGFHSTRIAEILNFRRSLPTTTTVAYVHALSRSPTVTEREIAELIRANILRKIVIPGRGIGGSTVGEGLVLLTDLEDMLNWAKGVDGGLKASFTLSEIATLKSTGFLTSSVHHPNLLTHSGIPNTPSTSLTTISRAASGSLAAVGGSGALIEAGGTLGLRRNNSHHESSTIDRSTYLQLALPSTGPYLRLLTEARSHLISLIHKSSKYREMPLYLLRERWDGGVAGDDPASRAKKIRGEFAGVLPARTKKWKHFWGLKFDWVLAECVGSGMVELFETGSVGKGVRVT